MFRTEACSGTGRLLATNITSSTLTTDVIARDGGGGGERFNNFNSTEGHNCFSLIFYFSFIVRPYLRGLMIFFQYAALGPRDIPNVFASLNNASRSTFNSSDAYFNA